jgi:DNA-binding transcriptional MerR regulator
LRSGELARLAGVSTDTLRHYERRGLIAAPGRSGNGYREYPSEALDRVRLVRSALAVGFTLDELVDILAVRDRGGAPCRRARALLEEKLEAVEA